MIEIKRLPSGQFLEFLERDIKERTGADLEPENMLDGKLGYMWLIFSSCLDEQNIKWPFHKHQRNRVVTTTLDKARLKRPDCVRGKDVVEQIEFYHQLLDQEATRRGGVVIDIGRRH